MIKKIVFLFFVAGSVHAQGVIKKVSGILDTVQPDSIKKHIAFLADDKLLGRFPGTPGFQAAVDYVISHYKQLGLQPAGDNNTYLQEVKIRKAKVDPGQCRLVFRGLTEKIKFGEDFVLSPNFEEQSVAVYGPLVFAGYGINAPEFGYDDYQGLDVKNKIVVITPGSPDKFSSTVRSHFMNLATISRTAFEKGAIKIMSKKKLKTAKRFCSKFILRFSIARILDV